MKLLRFKETEKRKQTFNITLNYDTETTTLSGTLKWVDPVESFNLRADYEKPFSFDLSEWKGKLIDVFFTGTNYGWEMTPAYVLKNCAIANGMPRTITKPGLICNVFRIAVRENIADSVIQLYSPHESLEGFEDIIDEVNTLSFKSIYDNDPYAKELIDHWRKKSDLQSFVDFKDSIAYIDSEVDLIIRFLLRKYPDDADELLSLLKIADGQSVLGIKDTESLKSDFTDKKATFRAAQRIYHNATTTEETDS